MENTQAVIESVKKTAQEMGYDPRYYVMLVEDADAHRGKSEQATGVLLDSGEIVSVTEAEPMIGQLLRRPQRKRRWLAVPKEVKARLGFYR